MRAAPSAHVGAERVPPHRPKRVAAPGPRRAGPCATQARGEASSSFSTAQEGAVFQPRPSRCSAAPAGPVPRLRPPPAVSAPDRLRAGLASLHLWLVTVRGWWPRRSGRCRGVSAHQQRRKMSVSRAVDCQLEP